MGKPLKPRDRSGTWILGGAFVGGIVGAIVTNLSYRPDSFWGDMRPLAVLVVAFYGAVAGGAGAAVALLCWQAFQRGVAARQEYDALPPTQQTTTRETYVAWRVLRVLGPLLLFCFLVLASMIYAQWRINVESNPWYKKRRVVPTPLPLLPLNTSTTVPRQ